MPKPQPKDPTTHLDAAHEDMTVAFMRSDGRRGRDADQDVESAKAHALIAIGRHLARLEDLLRERLPEADRPRGEADRPRGTEAQ